VEEPEAEDDSTAEESTDDVEEPKDDMEEEPEAEDDSTADEESTDDVVEPKDDMEEEPAEEETTDDMEPEEPVTEEDSTDESGETEESAEEPSDEPGEPAEPEAKPPKKSYEGIWFHEDMILLDDLDCTCQDDLKQDDIYRPSLGEERAAGINQR
jgi:hypothetical protein